VRAVAVLFAGAAALCGGTALAGGAARAQAVAQVPVAAQSALVALAARVLAQGAEASLPPNLSLVLRLGSGREPLAVRQAVLRSGAVVHVYNVLAHGAHAVVLLQVDEARHLTEAYRLDAGGRLARAVGYAGNGQAQPLEQAAAAGGYEREARLWQQFAGRLNGPVAPAPAP
jgi:hypothetical protein